MRLVQLVGLESSFTDRIAPTGPVLAVPGIGVNAGLFFETTPAPRQPAVCSCGALDFTQDMVAIHKLAESRKKRRVRACVQQVAVRTRGMARPQATDCFWRQGKSPTSHALERFARTSVLQWPACFRGVPRKHGNPSLRWIVRHRTGAAIYRPLTKHMPAIAGLQPARFSGPPVTRSTGLALALEISGRWPEEKTAAANETASLPMPTYRVKHIDPAVVKL